MDKNTSNLIDLVRADSDKKSAITVVKKHYHEIIQLKEEEGVGLKKIHEKICLIYEKDIAEKRLNLSLTNFYRIFHKLEQQGCKKESERGIVKTEKVLPSKNTLNEWDSKSGVDHPFKK